MIDRRAARDRLLISIAQSLELILLRNVENSHQTARQLGEAGRCLAEFTEEDGEE